MVNTNINNSFQTPEINTVLPAQQPTTTQRKSISKVFIRILVVLIAIIIIVFGLLNLLITIIQLKDFFPIINQLIYHTTYVNLGGQINLIQYFSSKLLGVFSSVLFIYSGFLLILRKPRGKKLFLIAILVMTLQIIFSVIFSLISHQEEQKSNEAYKKWRQEIQSVDRSTVTDLSTIWALKEPRLCKNIKVYNTRKNCITEFDDISLFTIDYCIDISNEYDKNLCFSDVAETQKDKNICYSIPDWFRKNYCLVGVAAKLKNETICKEVSEISNLHNTCILNVGIELRDPSYCERANDQIGKDNCYDNIAAYTHNRKLCDFIMDITYKQDCISKTK